MTKTTIDRFMDKVSPEPNSGCWLWTAGMSKSGYGTFAIKITKERAHRAAWSLFKGVIPAGVYVLHKCDTPLCVNPEHLFLGTAADNNRDMMSKGRHRAERGEAHHSHKLTVPQVKIIRRLISFKTLTHREIASVFSISRQQVTGINTGLYWTHIL
jgi:hypothetical protein